MSNAFHLRKAEAADVKLLFDWANDIQTRKNSFHSESIGWEEHETWFQSILQNPKRQIYIYCDSKLPMGQARIDISDDDHEAEVSYSIAREYRGLGHGKKMLSLLAEQVQADFPDVMTLVAEVKPENIASQRCFMDIGYKEKFRMYEYDLNTIRKPKTKVFGGQNGGGTLPNQ